MVFVIYKFWPKTQGQINSPLLVFSNGSPWHELLSLCSSLFMADELYLVPPRPTSPSLPPWTPSVSMCRSTWQPQLWTPIPKPHPWTPQYTSIIAPFFISSGVSKMRCLKVHCPLLWPLAIATPPSYAIITLYMAFPLNNIKRPPFLRPWFGQE